VVQTSAPTSDVPSKALAARAVGVIFTPRDTYAAIARQPRVLGALVLTMLVVISASFAFFSTDVGRDALLDQQVRTVESFGRPLNDVQYARLEQMLPYAGYFTAAGQLVGIPLVAFVIAAVLLAIFNALLGGDATYKQVLAIVVHAQLLLALQQLFVLPLDYAKHSLSSPTSLAVFFPFLDEASFASRMLGSIDLFWIWIIVNLSIGVGVLYKRRTTPIATTMLLTYAAAALVIAAARSALSGA
jgi:hypothetical protein